MEILIRCLSNGRNWLSFTEIPIHKHKMNLLMIKIRLGMIWKTKMLGLLQLTMIFWLRVLLNFKYTDHIKINKTLAQSSVNKIWLTPHLLFDTMSLIKLSKMKLRASKSASVTTMTKKPTLAATEMIPSMLKVQSKAMKFTKIKLWTCLRTLRSRMINLWLENCIKQQPTLSKSSFLTIKTTKKFSWAPNNKTTI